MRTAPPLSIGPLDPVDQEGVRALADAAAAVDGVAPLSEQPLLRLGADEPWLTHVTIHSKSGQVVGYAQVDRGGEDASAELVVHPENRRNGVGRMLLRTAERDARLPQFSGTPGQRGKALRVWAHGDTEAARAFAKAASYDVVRELFMLSKPLDPAVDKAPGTPVILRERSESQDLVTASAPGYTLRTFVPGVDDDAWVALNARAFATHPEQGRLTVDDLRARLAEPWFDADGFLLAETPEGELAGFHWTKVHGGPDTPPAERHGEVYAVGVDPDHQGRGLGRLLLDAGLAHLATRVATAVLYVDGDNTAARAVYEKAGFAQAAIDVQYARPVDARISA